MRTNLWNPSNIWFRRRGGTASLGDTTTLWMCIWVPHYEVASSSWCCCFLLTVLLLVVMLIPLWLTMSSSKSSISWIAFINSMNVHSPVQSLFTGRGELSVKAWMERTAWRKLADVVFLLASFVPAYKRSSIAFYFQQVGKRWHLNVCTYVLIESIRLNVFPTIWSEA